jgi:hypothetical protein
MTPKVMMTQLQYPVGGMPPWSVMTDTPVGWPSTANDQRDGGDVDDRRTRPVEEVHPAPAT